jgi:hypothetical protein
MLNMLIVTLDLVSREWRLIPMDAESIFVQKQPTEGSSYIPGERTGQ